MLTTTQLCWPSRNSRNAMKLMHCSLNCEFINAECLPSFFFFLFWAPISPLHLHPPSLPRASMAKSRDAIAEELVVLVAKNEELTKQVDTLPTLQAKLNEVGVLSL